MPASTEEAVQALQQMSLALDSVAPAAPPGQSAAAGQTDDVAAQPTAQPAAQQPSGEERSIDAPAAVVNAVPPLEQQQQQPQPVAEAEQAAPRPGRAAPAPAAAPTAQQAPPTATAEVPAAFPMVFQGQAPHDPRLAQQPSEPLFDRPATASQMDRWGTAQDHNNELLMHSLLQERGWDVYLLEHAPRRLMRLMLQTNVRPSHTVVGAIQRLPSVEDVEAIKRQQLSGRLLRAKPVYWPLPVTGHGSQDVTMMDVEPVSQQPRPMPAQPTARTTAEVVRLNMMSEEQLAVQGAQKGVATTCLDSLLTTFPDFRTLPPADQHGRLAALADLHAQAIGVKQPIPSCIITYALSERQIQADQALARRLHEEEQARAAAAAELDQRMRQAAEVRAQAQQKLVEAREALRAAERAAAAAGTGPSNSLGGAGTSSGGGRPTEEWTPVQQKRKMESRGGPNACFHCLEDFPDGFKPSHLADCPVYQRKKAKGLVGGPKGKNGKGK